MATLSKDNLLTHTEEERRGDQTKPKTFAQRLAGLEVRFFDGPSDLSKRETRKRNAQEAVEKRHQSL